MGATGNEVLPWCWYKHLSNASIGAINQLPRHPVKCVYRFVRWWYVHALLADALWDGFNFFFGSFRWLWGWMFKLYPQIPSSLEIQMFDLIWNWTNKQVFLGHQVLFFCLTLKYEFQEPVASFSGRLRLKFYALWCQSTYMNSEGD